jgi:hypothetical protein
MLSHHAKRALRDTCALPINSLQRTKKTPANTANNNTHFNQMLFCFSHHHVANRQQLHTPLLRMPSCCNQNQPVHSKALCSANQMYAIHAANRHEIVFLVLTSHHTAPRNCIQHATTSAVDTLQISQWPSAFTQASQETYTLNYTSRTRGTPGNSRSCTSCARGCTQANTQASITCNMLLLYSPHNGTLTTCGATNFR